MGGWGLKKAELQKGTTPLSPPSKAAISLRTTFLALVLEIDCNSRRSPSLGVITTFKSILLAKGWQGGGKEQSAGERIQGDLPVPCWIPSRAINIFELHCLTVPSLSLSVRSIKKKKFDALEQLIRPYLARLVLSSRSCIVCQWCKIKTNGGPFRARIFKSEDIWERISCHIRNQPPGLLSWDY